MRKSDNEEKRYNMETAGEWGEKNRRALIPELKEFLWIMEVFIFRCVMFLELITVYMGEDFRELFDSNVIEHSGSSATVGDWNISMEDKANCI